MILPGFNGNVNTVSQNLVKETKCLIIEFEHTSFCRAALLVINSTKFKGIVAKYALENDPKKSKLPPKLIPAFQNKKMKCSDDDYQSGSNCSDEEEEIHGHCAYCYKEDATYVCKDCLTLSTAIFYCRQEHQEMHWSIHKWDCRRLPKLVSNRDAAEIRENLKEVKQDFSPEEPPIFKENEFVKITHVVSNVSISYENFEC